MKPLLPVPSIKRARKLLHVKQAGNKIPYARIQGLTKTVCLVLCTHSIIKYFRGPRLLQAGAVALEHLEECGQRI